MPTAVSPVGALANTVTTITTQNLRVQTLCVPGSGVYCSAIAMANGTFDLQNSTVTVKGGGAGLPSGSRAIYLGVSSTARLTNVDVTVEDTDGTTLYLYSDNPDQPIVATLEQVTLTGSAYSLMASVLGGTTVDLVDSQLEGPLLNVSSLATLSCVNSLSGETLLGAAGL